MLSTAKAKTQLHHFFCVSLWKLWRERQPDKAPVSVCMEICTPLHTHLLRNMCTQRITQLSWKLLRNRRLPCFSPHTRLPISLTPQPTFIFRVFSDERTKLHCQRVSGWMRDTQRERVGRQGETKGGKRKSE